MFYLYSFLFSMTLLWNSEIPQVIEAHQKSNEYRQKHRRDTLSLDSTLCAIAHIHSQNMASKKVGFGHKGFDDRVKPLERAGFANAFGENVYYSSEKAEGTEAVEAWIHSKGHRKNLKDKTYKKVGYGVAYDKKGGTYYTQLFSN